MGPIEHVQQCHLIMTYIVPYPGWYNNTHRQDVSLQVKQRVWSLWMQKDLVSKVHLNCIKTNLPGEYWSVSAFLFPSLDPYTSQILLKGV